MKYELLMLRGLLVASMLVCGLILGNMLSYRGQPIQLAGVGVAGSTVAAACLVPQDGLACRRSAS